MNRGVLLLVVVSVAGIAAAAEKPALVLHRPADCTTPCDRIAAAAAHPAMQRRLATVDFEIRPAPEGASPAIAVHDPGGREAMRWLHTQNWLMLADILTLVELARPHLLASHRASLDGDSSVAEREWALAILSLGDRDRGRALLDAMRSSESPENRQLAAIWLERVAAHRTDAAMDEKVFARYWREGTTDRVRFEALMALGDAHVRNERYAEAIAAYDRAAKIEPASPFAIRNARHAREYAAALATPVLGLGEPGAVVGGRKTVIPRNLPKSTAVVEFRLDGRLVATAKRPPFAGSIDLDPIPARQTLRITARDRSGRVVHRSRVVINERSEAFHVTIVEPDGHELTGAIDVAVDVRVPQGRTVDQIIVEWNGRRIARLTAPPYRTRFEIGDHEPGVLRAVLRLDDGSEAEDVHLANSGTLLLEAEAHVVEVPAYFEDRVPAPREVVARENGRRRTIDRIIAPDDAPLMIGLLIDSSYSMIEHMLDVQEAAFRFLDRHLGARDKAMVVAFSSTARVVQRATNDRARLERAILALRPRGSTALHDAIVTALHQLEAPGSRKALIVFSDGLDAASGFSSDDVAEVARRTGVPIYIIALASEEAKQIPEVAAANQNLMAISTRSGAKAFEMRTLDDLETVWNEIGADLRTQSLVIYHTDSNGPEWRPLELTIGRRPVRAPSGVFVTTKSR